MKFALHLAASPRHYGELAGLAEEAGFDTIYVPEHLVFPADMPSTYPYSHDGVARLRGFGEIASSTPTYDPWVQLGFLAARTVTIRLATAVSVIPLYHPLFLARSLTTLDRLSGGRVTLGAGLGWLEFEFAQAGVRFSQRASRAEAAIELLRRLWGEDAVEHHDRHFDIGPVSLNPKPLQKPSIPIHLGGSSHTALRRVGRLGDGWLEFGGRDLDQVIEQLAVVTAERERTGRSDEPFEVTTWLPISGDRDLVQQAEDAGIHRIAVNPEVGSGGGVTPSDFRTWAYRFRDRNIREGS